MAMKLPDWRSRAVVMRLVVAMEAEKAVEFLLTVPGRGMSGKRDEARSSTERPPEDWQRVPVSSIPQMPK
jgi:hypothetical protein